ncbi:MAG: winged helix-turn-helix domain-containing protein [Nitrososphaera sp.]|jgi:predicted transcriptional regulator
MPDEDNIIDDGASSGGSGVEGPAEVRQEKVMALRCRGLHQDEIAKILGVSQPTVSRDLRQIKRKSLVDDDDPRGAYCLANSMWAAGLDEIMKKAWELVADEKADYRSKMGALAFLARCNDKRLLPRTGRPL